MGKDTLAYYYDTSGMLYAFDYKQGGAAAERYYYHRSPNGDIVGILDANGNMVVEYAYDAWGNLLSMTGSMASTVGTINPFRYKGYYYDNETGFYYLQSRYYDPQTHRFLNADGYASTGQGFVGNNMFAYCLNNPVSMVDPTGTEAYKYYYTYVEAAYAAADHLNHLSAATDWEWATQIYSTYAYVVEYQKRYMKLFGKTYPIYMPTEVLRKVYYYTTPITSKQRDHVGNPAVQIRGSTLISRLHSHPENSLPSGVGSSQTAAANGTPQGYEGDYKTAYNSGLPSLVSIPNGTIYEINAQSNYCSTTVIRWDNDWMYQTVPYYNGYGYYGMGVSGGWL